jgi:hypothetical protein
MFDATDQIQLTVGGPLHARGQEPARLHVTQTNLPFTAGNIYVTPSM